MKIVNDGWICRNFGKFLTVLLWFKYSQTKRSKTIKQNSCNEDADTLVRKTLEPQIALSQFQFSSVRLRLSLLLQSAFCSVCTLTYSCEWQESPCAAWCSLFSKCQLLHPVYFIECDLTSGGRTSEWCTVVLLNVFIDEAHWSALCNAIVPQYYVGARKNKIDLYWFESIKKTLHFKVSVADKTFPGVSPDSSSAAHRCGSGLHCLIHWN